MNYRFGKIWGIYLICAVLVIGLTSCSSIGGQLPATVHPALPTSTLEPTFTPSPAPVETLTPTQIDTLTPEPTPSPTPEQASLSGRIFDQDTNQPIAEAQVSAGTSRATTDADGRYTLTGLLPGQYVLSVTHPDFDPGLSSIFTMATGEEYSVDIPLYAPDTSPYPADPMLTNPLDPNGAPTAADAERLAREQGFTGEVTSIRETKLSGEFLVNYKIGDNVRAAVAQVRHEVWELIDEAGRKWWIIKVCGNLASRLPEQSPIATPAPKPLPPMAEVLADGLVVRECAAENCGEVGSVPGGEQVEVFGCLAHETGGWCEVGWSGVRGWCTGQSLRQLAVASTIPILETSPPMLAEPNTPGGGLIAYAGIGDDSWTGDLWSMNSDGGNKRQITQGLHIFAPTWSPDGQRIAFIGTRSTPPFDDHALYLVNQDGSNLKELDRYSAQIVLGGTQEYMRLSWSPDSKKIAYIYTTKGVFVENSKVAITDVESGERLQSLDGGSPAWAPDGSKIALLRSYNGPGEGQGYRALAIIDLVNAQVITWFPVYNVEANRPSFMAWAPDGSRLAIGSAGKVVVTDLNGENEILVGQPPEASGEITEIKWSPDGTKLVYRNHGAASLSPTDGIRMDELFLIDLASKSQSTLFSDQVKGALISTYNIVRIGGPSTWSPDSKALIASYQDKIWLIDAKSGERREIGNGTFPAWQPGPSPVVSIPIPLPTPVSPRPTGEDLIAFLSTRDHSDNTWELYIMKGDGTAQFPVSKNTRLWPGTGYNHSPLQWTPDKNEVFLVDQLLGPSSISISSGELNTWTLLGVSDSQVGYGKYSPDGKKFAYVDGGNIFVINADGSNPQQVTHFQSNAGVIGSMTWSPDSDRLAFTGPPSSMDTKTFSLFIVNVDGTDLRKLSELLVFNIIWSPKGDKLAFLHKGDLWHISVDGTGLTKVTDLTDLGNATPTWSPDGTKIAFRAVDVAAGKTQIYVINANGTGLTQLTTEGSNCCPAWLR